MARPDWRTLGTRYGPLLAALTLVLIVPAEARQAIWKWALKGSDLMDVFVVGLILSRVNSHGEHREGGRKLDALHDKLENGIKARLDTIERHLGCDKKSGGND